MIVLKVSATTDIKELAGAIERQVHKHGSIEVHAVGEEATYRATKGIAIAGNIIKCRKVDLITTIQFKTVKLPNKKLTVMNFIVGKEKF